MANPHAQVGSETTLVGNCDDRLHPLVAQKSNLDAVSKRSQFIPCNSRERSCHGRA